MSLLTEHVWFWRCAKCNHMNFRPGDCEGQHVLLDFCDMSDCKASGCMIPFEKCISHNKKETKYEILVSNIGTITAENELEAQKIFDYVRQSQSNTGRASNEQVTLLIDDHIAQYHIP
jgi:hypothetical protein